MSMYEKEDKAEEIVSLLRILDTKINMIMSDTEQLQETVTQLKFLVETAEENRIEEETTNKNASRWKREVL